ncbi:MAG: ADP-glyceromanno-heptose 6-epimerase [Legionellales bacterium]|nr:ADP-glyceromanno-heptose 6-epimerase [Legionellales bacterium]
MIIVTGGAGFIGSNLVKALNQRGRTDILVVDDLSDAIKYHNIVDCDIYDYIDKNAFLELCLSQNPLPFDIDVIFHQGACSDTTNWDGLAMMETNYEFSKALLHMALDDQIPFIYASSAATYGMSQHFTPNLSQERPLNFYGYTKLLFDRYVNQLAENVESQIVGLRYFNVYGAREDHKKHMCSAIRHFYNQLMSENKITIFSCENCAPGEQQRDFITVEDVIKVNLWCWDNPKVSGLFNCGSGVATPFNHIAQQLIHCKGQGEIDYKPLPEKLRGCYQTFTQADMSALRAAGFKETFIAIEQGIRDYFDFLQQQK